MLLQLYPTNDACHNLPTGAQVGAAGFDPGNGEKLNSIQATPARQAAWLLHSFSPFPVSCGPTLESAAEA